MANQNAAAFSLNVGPAMIMLDDKHSHKVSLFIPSFFFINLTFVNEKNRKKCRNFILFGTSIFIELSFNFGLITDPRQCDYLAFNATLSQEASSVLINELCVMENGV